MAPTLSLGLLAAALFCLLSKAAQGLGPVVRFRDVTREAGIQFTHVNAGSGSKYYIETMGAGCAFFDYDNDGNLDIYLVNGAVLPGFKSEKPIAGALYRNNGDGTFADVTAKAGVGAEDIYGMGVAVGDYDNDGHTDFYITGYQRGLLFHNEGNGTFKDLTAPAGVSNSGLWGTSAAFLDYDNDGFLDLFVTNYVDFDLSNNIYCGDRAKGIRSYCRPLEYQGSSSVLYHNERNGRFTDGTKRAGLVHPGGKGLGAVASDVNSDGWVDIYVANDGVANLLYLNRGDGTFREGAALSGVAYDPDGQTRAGMGVDVGDYDRDGLPDILVTNFSLEGAALFRNEGHEFTETSIQTGLRRATFLYTGWGTKLFDYDNDGDLDIFITNGHPEDTIELFSQSVTYAQPRQLLENEGGRFVEVSAAVGDSIVKSFVGRGVASGDFDNDGDIDLLVTNNNGSPTLLRNDGGNRNHWIKLRLLGNASNRDAIGARVTVKSGQLVQSDQVSGGGSYLASSDTRLNFGMGERNHVDSIEIRWPSGVVQRVMKPEINQILTVEEESGVRPK